MHPAMIAWWKSRHEHHGHDHDERRHAEASCGPRCGPRGEGRHEGRGEGRGPWGEVFASGGGDDDLGAGFGVRRPLRFLAWKLELEDNQVAELARVLNDLKTERAQAAVDNRRAVAGFADALGSATLDEAKLADAAKQRVESAERLRGALVKALSSIHATLDDEQRQKLAYLIRTGQLSL
jgi:Spy/CpxP family protein refolding chaperone